MWLGLAITHGLLLTFITIELTTTLVSTVTTKPSLNVSLPSLGILTGVSSNAALNSFSNTPVSIMDVQASSTTMIHTKERNENATHKSATSVHSNPLASLNHEQSSATLGVHGKTNTSETENTNMTDPMPWEKSKTTMLTTTLVKSRQSSLSSTADKMPPNSGKTQFNNIATSTEKEHMKANSTTGISSFEEKQANKTSVLEPSSSLVSKKNTSETNTAFSSPIVDMTELSCSKMSKGRINPTRNDTMVQHGITAIANRTTMASHTSILSQFSKMSSNQTHIADNFTTSFYNTITNRTEEIQMSPSITMVKKHEANYAIHASGSTNSIRNVQISETIVEMKPSSTTLFADTTIQYSTQVSIRPTPSSTKLKVQQFSVTIKITSETFRNEYITSAREFMQKGREIKEQFDQVFKDMEEYLYTDVLRFFSGSLGCDVVIHTESVESKPVSIDRISNTLKQAKSTKGGFGKYVVGNIDVEEKNPHVQGRDDDNKETWGRMPIIVISILAVFCFILLVMVITQCVSKTT